MDHAVARKLQVGHDGTKGPRPQPRSYGKTRHFRPQGQQRLLHRLIHPSLLSCTCHSTAAGPGCGPPLASRPCPAHSGTRGTPSPTPSTPPASGKASPRLSDPPARTCAWLPRSWRTVALPSVTSSLKPNASSPHLASTSFIIDADGAYFGTVTFGLRFSRTDTRSALVRRFCAVRDMRLLNFGGTHLVTTARYVRSITLQVSDVTVIWL